jgi:predicted nuclease of predicted toxin-antitoxin system
VKLLFDQNLSFRLVGALSDLFPNSAHVRDFALTRADDDQIWDCAKTNGFTIISKDSDFRQRSFLFGAPPKAIWIDLGNCSTKEIEDLLRKSLIQIMDFDGDPAATLLVLS